MTQSKLFITIGALLLFLPPLYSCSKDTPKIDIKPEIVANWNELENDDIIKRNKEPLSQIHYDKFFKNKELIRLIDEALKNNKDLKIAALNIKSAHNYYRIKRADLLPQISTGIGASRQKISKNSLGNFGGASSSAKSFIVNNYEANLATASFELDLFNKLKYINEAAFNDFLAKIENKNSIKISLISQIANSYIQWLADLKLLKISKERLSLERQYFKIAKASYESGFKSKSSLLRAKNSLELAKSDLAAVREITKKDKNIIISLLGAQNDVKIKTLNLNKIRLNDKFYVDLSSEILLLRPDVIAAEYQLKAQDANIKVARASFFPTISLTGSYGFTSNKFSDLITTSNSGSWNVGAGINIPIFSGFRNSANLKMQKIEREIAVENYQKTIQTAFKEVNDKLVTRKALKVNLKSSKNITKSNGKIYKMDKKFFELGSKNKIELIESKRQFLAAQAEEVTSTKKSLVNQIELYKVLGGGF